VQCLFWKMLYGQVIFKGKGKNSTFYLNGWYIRNIGITVLDCVIAISKQIQWDGIRFYFNGWTREYPVKTTDIPFVTDTIYYTTLYRVHLTTSSMFLIYKTCSRHDIAEILLKLVLNTNQSINQSLTIKLKTLLMVCIGVLNYWKFTYHSIATSTHWKNKTSKL
jgi:hypothetical protein